MKHYKHGVSAIVAAYNEEKTILPVLRVLEKHPLVDEIIVVSDGSTDRTVRQAKKSSATVIALPENRGKGQAMQIGVKNAQYDLLLFIDADLIGFREWMVTLIIEKIRSGEYDMFTYVRDRPSEMFQLYLPASLSVGGERALSRRLWDAVPPEEKTGYSVEMALNYFATKEGMRVGMMLAEGLKQTPKEKKWGFIRGFVHRVLETIEFSFAAVKYFVFHYEKKQAFTS